MEVVWVSADGENDLIVGIEGLAEMLQVEAVSEDVEKREEENSPPDPFVVDHIVVKQTPRE